jgi:hypothetical protein
MAYSCEERRIRFSDGASSQFGMFLTLSERASEGIFLSAICPALRFYTAKTHSEHQAHCAASTMLGLTRATTKTRSNTFAEIA